VGEAVRIHPRTRIVQRAEIEIGDAVSEAIERHDLTIIEVTQILASAQLHWLKYALRAERHPDDPDKGGDEA
jgi:hypothetical protein